MPIPDETIGDFLDQSLSGAPGRGAVSALQAAQGAPCSAWWPGTPPGEKYAEHQVTISRIVAEVDELRAIALRLAEADADAFRAVTGAYLAAAIHRGGAGRPLGGRRPGAGQRGLAASPGHQRRRDGGVDLAEALAAIGNRNVISDVAAAAEAAGAAAATAPVKVEINLAGITDEQASLEMIAETDKADDIITRAEQVTATAARRAPARARKPSGWPSGTASRTSPAATCSASTSGSRPHWAWEIQSYVDRGDLVPACIVLDMLRKPVVAAVEAGGYVLDGFPRTVEQAQASFPTAHALGVEVQAAVHLDVPRAELVRRLLARGRGSDDTEAVIEHRLQVYLDMTVPLLEYYAGREWI